jgi:phenylalanyl-tRNA synthetase alpha chain
MHLDSEPSSKFSSQVTEITDTTQNNMKEIALTGTLKSGEKVLPDLRKRKLISQR